jgi:monoamine oxidase
MAHSRLFTQLRESIRIANLANRARVSAHEACERAVEQRSEARDAGLKRRDFLLALGATGAALGTVGARKAWATPRPGATRIAIVGAGMAGLACADTLRQKGYVATVYEANRGRVGGRISTSHRFAGLAVEKGGEFIDGAHKTMLRYANELGLVREDLIKAPGEAFYYVGGQRYAEEAIVEEFRQLVPRMRDDFKSLNAPTFYQHTPEEEALDRVDLASYLAAKAGDLPLVRAILDVAYNIEYGVETSEQSCLALLLFLHLDRSSKFRPFGIFSNERFHIIGGNAQIPQGIAQRLERPVEFGATLTRLGRSASGEYLLYFNGSTQPERADTVVLTLPFSVLRNVILEPSLGLSPDKTRVISQLVYGSNAKTMIGFYGRPWSTLHQCNGDVYADLPNLQSAWETNWTAAGALAVLTDYSGGTRGRIQQVGTPSQPLSCSACHSRDGGPFLDMHYENLSLQGADFLADLEKVLPGVSAAAVRDASGQLLIERGHWMVQSNARGSYTANQPGYFTTMADLESEPAQGLKFAGEHTDSFYSWQGFMEGACLSGIRAANEVLDDIKRGLI